MAGDRHTRAREQTIELMSDAARRGDWLDALQWLNTLAAVDLDFSLTSDQILAARRDRARRFRNGDAAREPEGRAEVADFRGMFAALLEHAYDGIVLSDARDGWMLECSRSFTAMTGYPAKSCWAGRRSSWA
jgi:PAS domain-containing protein